MKRFNEDRLPDYLSTEYLPGDETLFTGVHELLPGHCFTWQQGRLNLERYGKIRFRVQEGRTLGEWAERIDGAFTGSVAAHRVADVEVGCFLSGGVDSTLTACKAARQQEHLQCFTVGYAEEAYSELPAARQAAEALGVPCTETTVSAGEFFPPTGPSSGIWMNPCPTRRKCPCIFCARPPASG